MRPSRLRRVTVLLLGLVLFLASPSIAGAQNSDETPVEESSQTGQNGKRGSEAGHEEDVSTELAEVLVWGPDERAPGGPATVRTGLRSWIDDCTFTVVDAQHILDRVYLGDESKLKDPLIDGARVEAFETEYWIVRCSGADNPDNWEWWTRGGYLAHYPVGGTPPRNVIELVRQSAYDSVPLVVFMPRMSPPGTPDHALITQLETWLFVDPASWVPVSATASVPGLSVTVTSTPGRNTWTGFDEPRLVVCEVNIPYAPGMESHPCAAIVKNKDPHTIRLETEWTSVYVCLPVGPGCTGGRMPSQATASEFVPTITSVTPVITR